MKMMTLMLLFLFLFTQPVMAHTGLKSSNPSEGSTVTTEVKEITLTFQTTLEETSSFSLMKKGGEAIAVEQMDIENDTMTGSFSQPLENGGYTVEWEIIGVDGHPISGTFSFTVSLPVKEEVKQPVVVDHPEVVAEVEAPITPEGPDRTLVNGASVAMGLVFIGSVWWLWRRR